MHIELKWLLFLILMAFDGLFLVALGVKYVEVKRASLWAAVPGRIVSSRSEARKVVKGATDGGRDQIRDTEIRNFAAVTYQFQADGKRQQGNRISIKEDLGNYQVAEKLKRYPVGANVTVYFDRNRPSDNVLERDMPVRSFEIAMLIGILVGLGGLFLLLISDGVFNRLSGLVSNNSGASGALFVAIMGILAVIFGYATYRRGAATQAWPKTMGQIVSSKVEAVETGWAPRHAPFLRRWLLRDRTIYSYSVEGVAYQSDRTSFGAQTYASFSLFAARAAERFGTNGLVEVFYNPQSPEEAVLVRGAPGQVVIWISAALLFWLAAHLAGLM